MPKKLSCPKRTLNVSVTFKTPIGKKTQQMCMTRKTIQWYKKNKGFSPYKGIKIKK